jgi:hypothetical protein
MQDYDIGFKIVARTAAQPLARVARVHCDRVTPVVSEVQTAERLADRVFQAVRGRRRFLLYFEAYTRWHRAAPWSVLAKSGLLSQRERLPTVSVVYILLPRGYQAQEGRFRLEVEGELTQEVRFHEVCLWQVEPAPWWEAHPGLMPLYPLCRHQRRPREAVTRAAQVIEGQVTDPSVRGDLLTTLGVFGKLAYPHLDPHSLIGRENMRESKFYQEIMAEGELKAKREAILSFLEERFGSEPTAQIADQVNALENLKQLDLLVRLAARCATLNEFRKALGPLAVQR